MELQSKKVDKIPEAPEGSTVLEDGYVIQRDQPAGTFALITDPQGNVGAIDFVCPCGCGARGAFSVTKFPEISAAAHQWDGNEELPTVTPSILRKAGCQWHGHLTRGVFRSC